MDERFIFRKIEKEELPALFELIKSRIRWMDEVGIEQWNKTHYTDVYPMSYYEGHRKDGRVFVLMDTSDGTMAAAAVIKTEDDRWPENDVPAYYLHNFASDIKKKGSGSVFLSHMEEYAKSQGMAYMRLDSAVGNRPLEDYYTARGYVPCGTCVDGLYEGILRQKALKS